MLREPPLTGIRAVGGASRDGDPSHRNVQPWHWSTKQLLKTAVLTALYIRHESCLLISYSSWLQAHSRQPDWLETYYRVSLPSDHDALISSTVPVKRRNSARALILPQTNGLKVSKAKGLSLDTFSGLHRGSGGVSVE